MANTQAPNFLYDLSNPHFASTELITMENEILKGRFIQFKVVKGTFEYLYPAEKYCFLPFQHFLRFKKDSAENLGEFAEFPDYVLQMSMRHIKQIKITTELVTSV